MLENKVFLNGHKLWHTHIRIVLSMTAPFELKIDCFALVVTFFGGFWIAGFCVFSGGIPKLV
jgi:hypothetical protein